MRDAKKFSTLQFWRVFGYFALRGAFFNVWRYLKRDRYNCHYLDALKRLKHKVRLADVAALRLARPQLGGTARSRCPAKSRVFLGLQLFPEASMDYWLASQDMLAHDDVVVSYCEVLGQAGYHTFVKDHPLQFGFRQRELFERLSKLPYVTLVPYDVPAVLLIESCAVSVTFTGTIGFPGGACRTCARWSPIPITRPISDFLHIRNADEIDGARRSARAVATAARSDGDPPRNPAALRVNQRRRRLFRLEKFRSRATRPHARR